MIQQFINREVINKIYSNVNNQFKKYMYNHRLQKKNIKKTWRNSNYTYTNIK